MPESAISRKPGGVGLSRYSERITEAFQDRSIASLSLFLGLLILIVLARAAKTPLWADEILTFHIFSQPTWGDIYTAILDLSDAAPPLYAYIARALYAVFGSVPIAERLPAVVGVCATCASTFVFARRRLPGVYAAMAMLMTCLVTLPYAWEGRPYGLATGCIAVAMLCWQNAADGKSRLASLLGLVGSLALAIALQYFFLLMLLAFGAAEIRRALARRNIDWSVWFSLGLAPLVLLPHLPLLVAARKFIPHHWARLDSAPLLFYYRDHLGALSFLLIAGILLYFRWESRGEISSVRPAPGLLSHEQDFAAVLAILPILYLVIQLFTDQLWVARYLLPSTIGVSILLSAALWRVADKRTLPGAVAVLTMSSWLVLSGLFPLLASSSLREGQRTMDKVAMASAGTEPIVIANQHEFLEIWYYGGETIRSRIVYLIDPGLELQYTGSDTNSLLCAGLQRHTRMSIEDYQTFTAKQGPFLLAARNTDWLLVHMLKSGFRVKTLSPDENPALYEVSREGR